MTILKNIHSTAEDYQQLTEFYAVYKDEWFSSIHVSLKQWFSANMSAPLGALLDLLQENVNDVTLVIPHNATITPPRLVIKK